LIEYQPYRGVCLTDKGKQVALQLIRKHRLIESFLAQSLGYSWDEVHQEADTLEHAITEALGDRIAASLLDPKTDPHGSLIPDKDGTVEDREEFPLSEVETGENVIVLRVSDHSPQLLRYLGELEVKPWTPIRVLERGRFDDLFHIQNSQTGKSHHLSRFVADHVFVTHSDEA
jgi:DtxR family Mn-dependent transcriptional regulator